MDPKRTVDEGDPGNATTLTGTASGAKPHWSLPAEGTRVSRYEVRKPLGSGGMGAVVAAWDPELARPVALKFVGRIHRGGEQEMLLREAQAMAQLKHPNVLPIYDVGTYEGRVFLAMELVDGSHLKDWVDAHRRDPHEIIDLLCQVGAGLAAAHAAGIVHRDVKPGNVLVDHDGRARLTDFGIARVGEADVETPTPPVKGPIGDTTALGQIVGTVGYLAPEALSGEIATPAADQFALAVTAWQLLTGVLPFGQAVDTTLVARLSADQIPPKELGRVPRRLRKVLRRALSGDPKRRYPSVKAFCEALAPPPPASRRRWAVRIAAAVVLIPVYLVLAVTGIASYAVNTLAGACRGRAMTATLGVWPPARLGAFSARHGVKASAVAEAYVARWRDASLGACLGKDVLQRPTRVAQAQRDCLDGALLAFDARASEVSASASTAQEADQRLRELDDPRGCVDQWTGETRGAAPWPP